MPGTRHNTQQERWLKTKQSSSSSSSCARPELKLNLVARWPRWWFCRVLRLLGVVLVLAVGWRLGSGGHWWLGGCGGVRLRRRGSRCHGLRGSCGQGRLVLRSARDVDLPRLVLHLIHVQHEPLPVQTRLSLRGMCRVCRVSYVCVVCRVSCVVCRVSCVVCRVSCVVCRVSCVVCRVSCVVCRIVVIVE
jgi:hypothetical protein